MALVIPKETYSGKIYNVQLGGGAKAVTIGGGSALPFLGFEGTFPNKPAIAPEVMDIAPDDWPETLKKAIGGEAANPVSWAKFCQKNGADMIALSVPWPPQKLREMKGLVQHGLAWLGDGLRRCGLEPSADMLAQPAADAFRTVAAHLRGASERLRLFVDAQLLIAAQTTSPYANALYGAAALDLPRRGVVHMKGGMGAIAEALANPVRQNGGQVQYRQEVTRVVMQKARPVAVETSRGKALPADLVVAYLPPWNILPLLGGALAAIFVFTGEFYRREGIPVLRGASRGPSERRSPGSRPPSLVCRLRSRAAPGGAPPGKPAGGGLPSPAAPRRAAELLRRGRPDLQFVVPRARICAGRNEMQWFRHCL